MIYKIINKLCPENLWNKFQKIYQYTKYDAKFSKNLQILKHNLEYSMKRFSCTVRKVWNEIPIRDCSLLMPGTGAEGKVIFLLQKLVTHPDFESAFENPSKNLPKV